MELSEIKVWLRTIEADQRALERTVREDVRELRRTVEAVHTGQDELRLEQQRMAAGQASKKERYALLTAVVAVVGTTSVQVVSQVFG